MSPRGARRDGRARAAVVGAVSGDGCSVRDALVESGVPGSRVDLYACSDGEVLLGEYAGEARLIQEADAGEIGRHDVIFLCETGEIAEQAARAAGPHSVVIDVSGSLPAEAQSPLVHTDINPEAARDHPGRLRVPHLITALLTELLLPLERRFGLEEVVAFVLRPAADFGEAGVKELREQTLSLLNFGSVPTDTFGRQLAFNILPGRVVEERTADLERRVIVETESLMGWDGPKMTLKMLTAPVFYGHCLQVRFRLKGSESAEEIQAVLEEGRFFAPGAADGPATPLEVATDASCSVSGLVEDGLGGFWLWAVAGDTPSRAAAHAVRLAEMVSDL